MSEPTQICRFEFPFAERIVGGSVHVVICEWLKLRKLDSGWAIDFVSNGVVPGVIGAGRVPRRW